MVGGGVWEASREPEIPGLREQDMPAQKGLSGDIPASVPQPPGEMPPPQDGAISTFIFQSWDAVGLSAAPSNAATLGCTSLSKHNGGSTHSNTQFLTDQGLISRAPWPCVSGGCSPGQHRGRRWPSWQEACWPALAWGALACLTQKRHVPVSVSV